MTGPELVIIAAVGIENRVIGKGRDLPWHIPEDLKRFKELTHGHPILMGHRTFESLVHQFGGPLKGRRNLVLATTAEYPGFNNVEVYRDIDPAIDAASDCDRLFIGGGASVYRAFLERVDRLELTLVDGSHDGDVFFPPYEHLIGSMYELAEEDIHDGFRFATYVRRADIPLK
jgi:dihydrofolate reductase